MSIQAPRYEPSDAYFFTTLDLIQSRIYALEATLNNTTAVQHKAWYHRTLLRQYETIDILTKYPQTKKESIAKKIEALHSRLVQITDLLDMHITFFSEEDLQARRLVTYVQSSPASQDKPPYYQPERSFFLAKAWYRGARINELSRCLNAQTSIESYAIEWFTKALKHESIRLDSLEKHSKSCNVVISSDIFTCRESLRGIEEQIKKIGNSLEKSTCLKNPSGDFQREET